MEVNRVLVDQDPNSTPEERYKKRLQRVVDGIRSGEFDSTLVFVRMPDGRFGAIVNTSVANGRDERAQEEFELEKVK